MKTLFKLYEVAQVNYLFMKKEINSPINVNMFKRLKLLSKGFHGESGLIYQLSRNNYQNYLSDYNRLKSKFINKKYSFILNNKVIFEKMFRDYIDIPKTLALIIKGNIIGTDGLDNIEMLHDYLKEKKYVVIKPISGGGGNGVIIVNMEEGNIYTNNQKVSKEEFNKIISKLDDCFISEYIEQGNFSEKLYNKTLNSLRIVTMIDPDTNKAFIPIAIQRIGTKNSAPADNWTQGGISAEINLETGEIGKGIIYPSKGELKWYTQHPDSKITFSGKKIPNWQKIKKQILSLAEESPYIKYIGWDVVITEEGLKVIEGNNCTDVNLLQVHKPLLKDDKTKSFYKHYNVI